MSVLAGAYMAWNIGANDCANAMASAVGAKVITLRQALVLATVLTFLGATFVGSHVAHTILKGIVDQAVMGDPKRIWLALLAALFAASLWVCLSTYKNLPVSTTHSIVGAMIGVGLVAGGPGVVHWGKVAYIVSSWILSPILSGIAGFLLFKFIDRTILSRMDTARGAVTTSPFLVAATVFIVMLSLFLETPLGEKVGLKGAQAAHHSRGSGFHGLFDMLGDSEAQTPSRETHGCGTDFPLPASHDIVLRLIRDRSQRRCQCHGAHCRDLSHLFHR